VSILWRKRYLINSCGISALLGDRRPVHRVCSQRLTGEATRTGWQAACKIRVAGLEPTEPLHGYRGGGLESPVKKGETVKSLLRVVLAFIAIYAFGISGAVAQDTHSQGTASSAGSADAFVDQQFALLRRDIRSVKKQLIAANLTLTDSEATKFWPVYDQYSTEVSKINDTRTALIKEYGDAYGSLTDEQADSLIRRWLDTDIAASELRRKYVSILRKVLDGRKAATFFQLDRRISMMIDLQLTSQLPLVQSQD
jgi:hypothetical protein